MMMMQVTVRAFLGVCLVSSSFDFVCAPGQKMLISFVHCHVLNTWKSAWHTVSQMSTLGGS